MSNNTQTIQQTSKGHKANMAFGCFTALVGLIIGSSALMYFGNQQIATVGGVVLMVGTLWFLFSKMSAWWNHG